MVTGDAGASGTRADRWRQSHIHITEPDTEAKQEGIDNALTALTRLTLQISLHDRDEGRRVIRSLLSRALHTRTRTLDGVLQIARAGGRLRAMANKLDPVEPGKLGVVADEVLDELLNVKTQADLERLGVERLPGRILALRNAAVYMAQLAVRASLAASEVAVGASVHGQNVNEEIDAAD